MCTTCGCGDPEIVPVELHEKILAGNDRTAAHVRAHFVEAGVLALNLMGSPGAGKTAVLEATARAAAGKGWRLGAVSADLATDNDARRLEAAGIPSKAITTGQACHLDAELVHRALHDFPWRDTDVFFIENVGNLVCPAIYDLGQRANVVVLSIAEGEDKPLKYPVMFKAADLVLLTKCDLVPHLDVDLARIHDAIARVMPRPEVIELSARTGAGMDRWVAWLDRLKGPLARAEGSAPHDHDHDHEHEHELAVSARPEPRAGGPESRDPPRRGARRLAARTGHTHPHEHVHAHVHSHGALTHAHPHAHAHAHGHAHAGGADDHDHGIGMHPHDGADAHDHAHERPAPPRKAGRKAAAKRANPKARARKPTAKKARARGRRKR